MKDIDLSKCRFAIKEDNIIMCINNYTDTTYCEVNDECYYKQLQKLKAENIELEQRLDDEMLRTTQLATENIKLEKEKRELKSQIKTYSKVNEEDTKEWLKCKRKLEKIKECCIRISNDYKAMSGEQLLAEDVLEIIESEE